MTEPPPEPPTEPADGDEDDPVEEQPRTRGHRADERHFPFDAGA